MDLRHTIFSKLEGSLCVTSVSTQSMLTLPAKTVRLSGGVTSSLRREWSAIWSVFYKVWELGIEGGIRAGIFESPGTRLKKINLLNYYTWWTPPVPSSLCTLQARLWILLITVFSFPYCFPLRSLPLLKQNWLSASHTMLSIKGPFD